MNYLKKIISVFITVIIAISVFVVPASALKVTSFTETPTGVEYNWDGRTGADGVYHYSYGTMTKRMMKETNVPVYCLQPNKATEGTVPTATELSKTPAWTSLNRSARDGIMWATMYGYRGGSNFTIGGTTYSQDEAYVATQILIWEWITAWRTNVYSNWSDNAWSNLGNERRRNCYKAILSLCQQHKQKVKLSTKNVTLKGLGVENAAEITGSGLSNYRVTNSSNDKIWYEIVGDKLKVWTNTSGNYSGTIKLTKTLTSNSTGGTTGESAAIGLGDVGQQMIYGTVYDPVSADTITVNVSTPATFKIAKTFKTAQDAEKAKGQIMTFFVHKDSKQVTTIELDINADGSATARGYGGEKYNVQTTYSGGIPTYTITVSSDYPTGTYTVSEWCSNKFVPQSDQTVTVKAGQTATVTFKNYAPEKASIFVKKAIDYESTSDEALSGFAFTLHISSDRESDVISGKTNADGSVVWTRTGEEAYEINEKLIELTQSGKADIQLIEYYPTDMRGRDTYKLDYLFPTDVKMQIVDKNGSSTEKTAAFVFHDSFTITSGTYENCAVADLSKVSITEATQFLTFFVTNHHKMCTFEFDKLGTKFVDWTTETVTVDGKDYEINKPIYSESALANVGFSVFAAEDIKVDDGKATMYYAGEQVCDELFSDENGHVQSPELFAGKYTIRETTTPKGYIKADDFDIELKASDGFSLEKDRVKNTVLDDVVNTLHSVNINLNKFMRTIDSEGIKVGKNGEIKDVVFGVYTEDNKLIAVLTDSNNFSAHFDNLPEGNYYAVELQTNEKYMLNNQKIEFTVSSDNTETDVIACELGEVYNIPYGYIIGHKTDKNGTALADCEFTLTAKADIYDGSGNKAYSAGDVVKSVKSDKDGNFIFDKLYYGEYTVSETDCPKGYILADSQDVEVKYVDEDDEHIEPVVKVSFINDYTTLKFEKFDENGNPLIGAKFELRDKDGNVIDTFVSDGSAKEWSKLPFGKYTIVETQAPEGYELNGEAKEFTISKDNKDVYVSMTDKPHTYLMTGGVGSAIFYVLGIGISLTAIAVIFYLTKKKKGNGDLDV